MNTSEARRLIDQVARAGEGRMVLVIEKDRPRARGQLLDFVREANHILPAGATLTANMTTFEVSVLGRKVRFEHADERLAERVRGTTLSVFWLRDGAMRHLDPDTEEHTMAMLRSRCL